MRPAMPVVSAATPAVSVCRLRCIVLKLSLPGPSSWFSPPPPLPRLELRLRLKRLLIGW